MLKKTAWFIFAVLCVIIGLYPLVYCFADRTFGLLSSKSDVLLSNPLWNIGFYGHISFGALALFIGWLQFSKKLRQKRIQLHRNIGKVYVLSALISSLCGICIGFFATGGLISSAGFISLGLIWFYSTLRAYLAIRQGALLRHQKMMIYSYAACFAAVTLRIWLPFLSSYTGDFVIAYRIVAWLSWVPNILLAYFLSRKLTLA